MIILGAVLGVCLASICRAEETDEPGGVGGAEAAEAFARSVLRNYTELTTYRDRFTLTRRFLATDESGKPLRDKRDKHTGRLLAANPNRYAVLVDEGIDLRCDGRHIWADYPRLNQYIRWEMDSTDTVLARSQVAHPAAMVVAEAGVEEVLSHAVLNSVEPEERDGVSGKLIRGAMRPDFLPLPVTRPVPFSAWVSDSDGLVREVSLDTRALMREMIEKTLRRPARAGEIKVVEAGINLRIEDVVLNEEIPKGKFVFQPDANDRKVDRFGAQGPRAGRRPQGGSGD